MLEQYEQPELAESARAINSLHVSWLYFNHETRKKYHLQKKFAFYYSDLKVDNIVRLEKEFVRLDFSDSEDYSIQESSFGDWHIHTICLTDSARKQLEMLGVRVMEKMH